jgi:hypothetical protein
MGVRVEVRWQGDNLAQADGVSRGAMLPKPGTEGVPDVRELEDRLG